MPGTVFWDVDTQRDFMLAGGALYIQGSEAILDNLERLTSFARTRGIRIVASVDSHTLEDEEISTTPDFVETFPPHCLEGTPGAEKVDQTASVDPLWIDPAPIAPESLRKAVLEHRGEIVFRKQRFDVFTNANVDTVLDVLDPDEIVVYGVALDVCDYYAIEGLLGRGRRLTLVVDAVRAIDASKGARLIDDWRVRGVHMVSTAELVQAACGLA